MASHIFNIELAKAYGIEEAILLHNMEHWIAKNIANGKHIYDNNYWTYNSTKAFTELFPYISQSKLVRVLKHLTDEGVLIVGNYNKLKFDRTNWYAFSEKGIIIMTNAGYKIENPFFKMTNGDTQNDKTIPYSKQQIENTNKTIYKESEIDLVEQVDTPDNTNVKTPPATDVSEKGVVVVSGAKVREWWQQYCPNLRQPIKWSTKTDNAVRTLLRTTNSTADDLKKAIMLIGSSSLCQGKGKTMSGAKEPWKATLDWLLKNTNDCFCGLFEGKYHFLNNDKDAYNRIIAGEEIEIKDSITDIKPPKGGVQWQG